jgi:hypothetical protein
VSINVGQQDPIKKLFSNKIVLNLLVGVLCVTLFTGILVSFSTKLVELKKPIDNVQALIRQRQNNILYPQVEGFQSAKEQKGTLSAQLALIPESQHYLVNFCPLTASLGGYIGNQVFEADTFVQNALRSGVRAFILPISTYLDDNKVPPNWPYSGKPAIVARKKEDQIIISKNALTVKRFCQSLVSNMAVNASQASEPILIFIQEEKVPDRAKEEKQYVKLMSDIAQELKDSIDSSLLLRSLGSYGSAIGGQRESEILTQANIKELYNKVIIFTNFDTLAGTKEAYKNIRPSLHEFANFIYTPRQSEKPRQAVSLRLEDISGSKINWSDEARIRMHITSEGYNLSMPQAAEVDGAVRAGIQIVPFPYLALTDKESQEKQQKIIAQWEGNAWRLKQPGARYTRPAPVVPQTPSARLNATVVPGGQPGMIGIF